MNQRVTLAAILGAAAVAFACTGAAVSQPKTAALRIGTFDSRAIALAFWHSEEGEKRIKGIFEEHKKAKDANDEKRVRELEIEGPGLQVRMHQQVFSTGSVTDIIEKIKTKLPPIAKEAGVSLIVPKSQIAYSDASVEYIDVTPQLVKLFNPRDETLKTIEELRKQEPVPIEKISYDPKN
jgi:Skp family chaperone for outer membrane proteins